MRLYISATGNIALVQVQIRYQSLQGRIEIEINRTAKIRIIQVAIRSRSLLVVLFLVRSALKRLKPGHLVTGALEHQAGLPGVGVLFALQQSSQLHPLLVSNSLKLR